jgi:uncharacterized membrane protein
MPSLSARSWLLLGLAGSVAVNLLLMGFVLGAAGGRAGGRPAPIVFDDSFSMRALFGSLSPEDRRAVRDAVAGEGARSEPLFRDLREARRNFEAVVAAEPFDAIKARAALERVRDVEHQLEARSGDLVVKVLGQLSPEERARVLKEMSERRFRGPRGMGGPGGRPGGPPGPGGSPPRPDRDQTFSPDGVQTP